MKGRTRSSRASKGKPPPPGAVQKAQAPRPPTRRRPDRPGGLQIAARWVLVAGIFFCPVVFDPDTADPFNLVKATVLWTFALVSGGLWVADKIRTGRGIRPSAIGWLGLLVLGITAAATLFSSNPALSTIGIYKRYGGLASTLVYVLVLWLLVDLYRDHRERLREVVLAVAWAGVFVAVYVFVQQFAFDPVEWVGNTGATLANPISTLGNSQFAGDYLGISTPALVYLLLTAPSGDRRRGNRVLAYLRSRRGLVSAALALVAVAMWFTQSRSGMVAALVGTLGIVFVARGRVPSWGRTAVVGLLIVGVVLGAAVLWHPGMERPPAPLRGLEVFRAESVGYRLYWWDAGARMVLDNPLLGTGPDTYGENLPEYRSEEEGAELGLWVADKPHNVFLERAVGTGLLGLGAYLFLLGAALRWAGRRVSGLDPPQRLLLGTFVGILLAYLAQGVFSIDVPPLALMGWVGLGGIAAFSDPSVVAEEEDEASLATGRDPHRGAGRGIQVAAYGLVVLVVGGVLVVGTRPLRADQQVKQARQVYATEGAAVEALEHFQRGLRLHPYEPIHRAEVGQFFENLAKDADGRGERIQNYERAIRFYQRAYELQPGNIYLALPMARLHGRIASLGEESHWEEADAWWRAILERNPHDWQVRGQYGQLLMNWGEETDSTETSCRAIEQFRRAGELHPQEPEIWLQLASTHLALRQVDEARAALAQARELAPDDDRAERLMRSLEGMTATEAEVCPA